MTEQTNNNKRLRQKWEFSELKCDKCNKHIGYLTSNNLDYFGKPVEFRCDNCL